MNIFFCYILAVHVRTRDHRKCSRVKKNRFKLAWCSDFVAPTYSAACFSLELRILCFIHQTVFNISYQTVSLFICHRLSFGNPAPFFVVWINRTSSFVGNTYNSLNVITMYLYKLKNCLKCGVPLDPSRLVQILQLALLSLWRKGVNCGR